MKTSYNHHILSICPPTLEESIWTKIHGIFIYSLCLFVIHFFCCINGNDYKFFDNVKLSIIQFKNFSKEKNFHSRAELQTFICSFFPLNDIDILLY